MSLEQFHGSYLGEQADIGERFVTRATIALIKKLVVGKKILNLGLGNGKTSKILDEFVKEQIVIEGSKKIIDLFSFKSPRTTFVESYFENYNTASKFEVILANHVLEHVNDPVKLMEEKFSSWIKKDGIIFITVPNAKSLHRLIGKEMGLLKSEYDLNNSDREGGHQRVYDINILRNHIEKAGFEMVDFGGYNIKMVSLMQMKDWSQELLDAIFEVSKKMPPDICANIWATVRKK